MSTYNNDSSCKQAFTHAVKAPADIDQINDTGHESESIDQINPLDPYNLTPVERAINCIRSGHPAKAYEHALALDIDDPDLISNLSYIAKSLLYYGHSDYARDLVAAAPEILQNTPELQAHLELKQQTASRENKAAHSLDFSRGYINLDHAPGINGPS